MLVKKVRKQIEKQHIISTSDRIIVGLSGGADSVCLLLILQKLSVELDFTLEAVHVEHGIRGEESRQDAFFAENLCRELSIPCQSVAIDVPNFAKEQGLGLEEAARILRYQIFEQIAKEKDAKIALAHHKDDNAETILFQMVRGSSLTGLCGMQQVRQSEAGVTYIRPLLCIQRKEIEGFLKQQGQRFCVDSTNQELEYSRNYIRNVILPKLSEVNTQAIAHIHETAEHLSEIRDFLDEQVQLYWEKTTFVDNDILLDVSKLKSLHVVLQKEIVYKAIGMAAGGKKDISSVHVEQVLELFENQSGKETTLPSGVVARKENETIRIFRYDKKDEREYQDQSIVISSEMLEEILNKKKTMSVLYGNTGARIEITAFEKPAFDVEIPRKTYTKWFDYDKIKDGFCIRTRQSGDYLICDVSGHRKKLKQYFVDEKIPVTKRDEMIILAQEKIVLWVVGGRISEHVKVTEQTKAIIEITMKEEM
ncbi:MAG: tRNA lysidine(34) synthetase TilS [Agathobacter sp.]|nr:tRNA lysidine(34) synthetase TilS [Agathobacter sp.]